MPAHELKSSIEIDATPRHVWTILTDFARYPEWNPFIPFIRGRPEPGNRLQVRIQPSGTKGMNFRPVVVAADKERELRWLGRLIVPGIFDGEHRFTIRALSDRTVLFEQSETFTGLLVPIFLRNLDRDTKRGFEEMNRALKNRAEAASLADNMMKATG